MIESTIKSAVAMPGENAPKMEWALWNVRTFGLPVFPVFELLPDGSCSCGKPAKPENPDDAIPGVDYCKSPGKHPATNGDWKEAATTDESEIRAMWTAHPNRNIGQRPTDLVLDLDRKPEKTVKDRKGKMQTVLAKDGIAEFAKLMGPDAMNRVTAIKTTSGGMHMHYVTDGKHYQNTTDHPAHGIDVRGPDGYVLAAGSTLYREVDGKMTEVRYEPVRIMRPQPLPAILAVKLREAKPRDAKSREAIGPLDTAPRIRAAAEVIRKCEPAIEGSGGNSHTYALAALIAEHGVSENRIMEMLTEWEIVPHSDGGFTSWNDACLPLWSWDDLKVIVGNACKYGEDAPGTRDMMEHAAVIDGEDIGDTLDDSAFEALQRETESAVVKAVTEREKAAMAAVAWEERFWEQFQPVGMIDPKTLKPFPWLYGSTLMRGELSLTVATSGIGKTAVTLLETYDMVTAALDLERLHKGKLRVGFVSFEDNRDVLERRMAAIRLHYKGAADVWGDRLFLASMVGLGFTLTERDDNGNVVVSEKAFALLESVIRKNRLDVLTLDPWVNMHGYPESSNHEIGNLALRLTTLALDTNCAIQVIHHTRKSQRGDTAELTQDDSRGGGSLVGKARLVRLMAPMVKDEASRNGIAAEERWRYFRVDDGKANHGPLRIGGQWFKKIGVGLGNGEDAANLKPGELPYGEDNVVVVEKVDLTPDTSILTAHQVEMIHYLVGEKDYRESVQAKSEPRIHDLIAEMTGLDVADKDGLRVIKEIKARLEMAKVIVVEKRKDGNREERAFVAPGPVNRLPEHTPDTIDRMEAALSELDEGETDFGDGPEKRTLN